MSINQRILVTLLLVFVFMIMLSQSLNAYSEYRPMIHPGLCLHLTRLCRPRWVRGYGTMSWKSINRIIGLASINLAFRQQLQQDPQVALEAQGIDLTPEELEAIKAFITLPFPQFCQRLSQELALDEHS